MDAKREQAFVGLFVLIAGALLVSTVFAIGGAFGGSVKTYHAYFPLQVESSLAPRFATPEDRKSAASSNYGSILRTRRGLKLR